MSKSTQTKSAPDEHPNPDAQLDEEAVRKVHVENLRERAGAAFLYGSMSRTVGEELGANVYQQYRQELLASSGNPHCPLETMLIESAALAYFNIGRLHIRSANTDNYQAAAVYAAAACKLTAEFRRLTLAIGEFRANASGRLGVVAADAEEESGESQHVA